MNLREFSNSYLELLTDEFSGINLTRITNEEEFYQKQIVDSVIPLELSKNFEKDLLESKRGVDIGFGGGFPILPLAFKIPNVHFTGFEARRKKAETVSKIAERLKIPNVSLYHMRVEDILFDEPVVITFKAVGTISDFLKKINTNQSLLIYFFKGPKLRELEDWSDILDEWKERSFEEYELEGTEGRSLICFQKRNVPRRTKSKKKNLFKYSDLL